MITYQVTNKAGGEKYIMSRRSLARILALVPKEQLLQVCDVGAIRIGDLSYYRPLRLWQPKL